MIERKKEREADEERKTKGGKEKWKQRQIDT